MEVNPMEKEPRVNNASEKIDDKNEANILPHDLILRYKIMKNSYLALSYVIFKILVE